MSGILPWLIIALCFITGDELLNRVLEEEEDLNMELVWEVVDHYKNSSILASEKEVYHQKEKLGNKIF